MKHQIVIIGGGNAGISVAAQLLRKNRKLDIAIVDAAQKHYYQPAWTLVGSGVFNVKDTERNEASVIPSGVTWIQKMVKGFEPENNLVVLDDNQSVSYDFLVVAAGIQLNWSEIDGLVETLGKNGVCSNYSFKTAPYTFECIQNTKSGVALFHNPHTPVKCGGAPHKIMYMAADYWRKHGVLDKMNIQYHSGGTRLFAIPDYENTMLKVCERANAKLHFFEKLVAIDGPNKRAKFVGFGKENQGVEQWINFDMIHVTPPQSAPDFIKHSVLANEAGWVDVDAGTLQHKKFPNVFSLGDCAGLPTSKTGAAIRKQAPVIVSNVLSFLNNQAIKEIYDGYTSCPVVTGYGKLVMAEFDYKNQRRETFPFDQSKERWSMYVLKRYILPWLYWNKILPGKM